jgi:hypothetical protein
LKLETVEYGQAKAHFVPVKDNARQKLRTTKDLTIAFVAAITSTIGVSGSVSTTIGDVYGVTNEISPSFHAENFFPAFNTTLDLLDKLMPYVNYGWQYNGVGYYGNYTPIPNSGNKIRGIEYGGYLASGLQGTFGDDHAINNTDRETSVYVSTNGSFLPINDQIYAGVPSDNSRTTAREAGVPESSVVFYRNIASYYASIKRFLPGQWGEVFSYVPVDTGFYSKLIDDDGNRIHSLPTIFGGDIFINRFAIKRKHSFFLKKSVNFPDGTDVDYNQDAYSSTNTGNVGYPIWYYSTSNVRADVDGGLLHAGIVNLTNALQNWAFSLLTLGIPIFLSALQLLIGLITDGLLKTLGIKITNLESSNLDELHERGQAYLYAYGVPYYFCESEVNVDMRQATNYLEGNFYPQVASDIPDDWLQETNVPIIFDNTYVYNKTYSKQNKETYFGLLRKDWSPYNPCFTVFNNRAIWSDKSNLEETRNNWLVYRPNNTKDLPKGYGKLQNIDNLSNNQILVRFENRSQIYNALTTLQVSAGPAAYIGNMELFNSPPLDLSHTDTGNVGSQHSMLLKTDAGVIFVDAKRGEVAILQGTTVGNLEDKGVTKWMYQNLPFKILDYFPDINIDNSFNGIGITGTYDPYFDRILITKKDYEPITDNIKYTNGKFYAEQNATDQGLVQFINNQGTRVCCPDGYNLNHTGLCVNSVNPDSVVKPVNCPSLSNYMTLMLVELTDEKFFCNKSWTLSYSFKTQSWVSFHSYIPDYYITFYSHFQAGNNALEQTWDHSYNVTKFNNFFGKQEPYILEYPYAYKMQDEILQSIKDFTTVRKYLDYLTFYEPDETIYFNKAIIYNGQQNTGILNLIPKPLNNLASYLTYPKYNIDSKDIIVTKSDNFYNYNMFWDIIKSKSIPAWITGCDMNKQDKDLNQINMDYSLRTHKKAQIRAKDVKIRHILDDKSDVRLISKFVLSPTVPSYK